MIDLVSASHNRDKRDSNLPNWMYYPRYADRIEAMGIDGLKRTIAFNNHHKRLLFDHSTM